MDVPWDWVAPSFVVHRWVERGAGIVLDKFSIVMQIEFWNKHAGVSSVQHIPPLRKLPPISVLVHMRCIILGAATYANLTSQVLSALGGGR